jgi:hypothetical protein
LAQLRKAIDMLDKVNPSRHGEKGGCQFAPIGLTDSPEERHAAIYRYLTTWVEPHLFALMEWGSGESVNLRHAITRNGADIVR